MYKWGFILLFLFQKEAARAQTLSGRVLSIDNNEPISLASVFLSNTSTGTATDNNGAFVINFPQGKFDLIVSCVGFETFAQSLQSGQLPGSLIIKLKPKVKELEEVVMTSYVKDGWKKWGKFFLENFVGTTPYAADCVIKNKEIIKFKDSKKTNTLSAVAGGPLVIENKALGYTIEYQLEDFRYNFNTHILFYYGYPLFKEMNAKRDRQKQRWDRNREDVYYGSLLHFMRSLFRNTLVQDGFEVRHLYKLPNAEKQRVRLVTQRINMNKTALSTTGNSSKFDSTAFYNNILSQSDEINYLVKTVLPGDSIAYAIDSLTAGVEFTDYLDITYTKKKESLGGIRQSSFPESQVTLLNNKRLEVLSNGSFFNPTDMLTSGYWSWSEKVATMLPFDYTPPLTAKVTR